MPFCGSFVPQTLMDKSMGEAVRREDALTVMRKALCSCFVSIDGTITLRAEKAAEAAKAITSGLRSQGFLNLGADAAQIEQTICGAMNDDYARSTVSVPAGTVANRLYDAIRASGQRSAYSLR
jgi:hypothetical protein